MGSRLGCLGCLTLVSCCFSRDCVHVAGTDSRAMELTGTGQMHRQCKTALELDRLVCALELGMFGFVVCKRGIINVGLSSPCPFSLSSLVQVGRRACADCCILTRRASMTCWWGLRLDCPWNKRVVEAGPERRKEPISRLVVSRQGSTSAKAAIVLYSTCHS